MHHPIPRHLILMSTQTLTAAMIAVAGFASASPVAEPIRIPLEFDKRVIAPAAKPVGGPASMKVTIYSGTLSHKQYPNAKVAL